MKFKSPNDRSNSSYRTSSVKDRQIDEVTGIIRGILADKKIHQEEADFFLRWIKSHESLKDSWPVKAIYPRILDFLSDGILDKEEEKELIGIMLSSIGEDSHISVEEKQVQEPTAKDEKSKPSTLIFTCPQPYIEFTENTFCLTGEFMCGSRPWVYQEIEKRGGITLESVSSNLDYLVVGGRASAEWIHSTYGRKIEKALILNESDKNIQIITEQSLFEALQSTHPLPEETKLPLSNKKIVITGTFSLYTRDELTEKIRKLGGKVISSVSASTDFVLVGEDPGPKFKKAIELGVRLLYEENLPAILNSEQTK